MAFTSAVATAEPRAFSIGPWKIEIVLLGAVSGDTSGTITSANLHDVQMCIVTGLVQTAQPVCSGKSVTLAFADPLATVKGQAILIGR